jgi:glycosyltransferase involved in cell wall biosynthesis
MAAVRHACYRGSRTATLPLVLAHRGGLLADPVVHRADALVVLTDAAAAVYRSYGVDARRLHVVPNFVEAPVLGPPPVDSVESEPRWAFVGRLSAEKGVGHLLARWPDDVRLDVYGDGPSGPALRRIAGPSVRFLGQVDRTSVQRRLRSYTGLVFPGRCLEGGYPMSVVEALAAGIPVLALAGSTAADLVEHSGAGAVVGTDATSEDWRSLLDSIAERRTHLSAAARTCYQERFTPQTWVDTVANVYSAARQLTPVG